MIRKKISIVGLITGCLALTCFITGQAKAQGTGPSTQCVPFVVKSGGTGTGCPGAYSGYVKMTNSAGSIWIAPPTNFTVISGTVTNATIGDVAISVIRKSDLLVWCDTNSSLTFPATNTAQYQCIIYVKSTPPPTNGQPIVVQLIWQ